MLTSTQKLMVLLLLPAATAVDSCGSRKNATRKQFLAGNTRDNTPNATNTKQEDPANLPGNGSTSTNTGRTKIKEATDPKKTEVKNAKNQKKPKKEAEDKDIKGTQKQDKQSTQNLLINGTDEQPRNGTDKQPRNGTDKQPRNGTDKQPRNGTDEQPRNGTDKQPRNGTDEQPRNGTDEQGQKKRGWWTRLLSPKKKTKKTKLDQ